MLKLKITIIILFLISCDQNSKNQRLVIANINVITMEDQSIKSNHTVVMQNDKITEVIEHQNFQPQSNDIIIEGKNKYLIPGLHDMHIHIDHPDVLKLFLAHGITTVLNFRGLPSHQELIRKAKKNRIFSPDIYTTGDYMEGFPATHPGFMSFSTVEDANSSIKRQKDSGAHFIKVYRNMNTEMHKSIIETASTYGMTTVGHLSPDISLKESLKNGHGMISHVEELMYFFENQNDTSKISELIRLLKSSDVVFTPNLHIFRSLHLQVENIDSINALKRMKYLQPAIKQSWNKPYNFNHRRGQKWATFMRARFSFLQQVTKRIQDAGIEIYASSDAPTSGAFPGQSIHEELQEFVTIGFTPYEALEAATSKPGKYIEKYIDKNNRTGLIKEGYSANLLVLDKNPFSDIKNTRSISYVIKNGQPYSAEMIKKKLDELGQIYEQIIPIFNQIQTEIQTDNISIALDLHSKAKDKFPKQQFLNQYTMWYHGYRYLYQNRALTKDPIMSKKAVQFYSMYKEEYAERHGTHYILGIAFKANKDTLNAMQSFNKAVEIHPFDPYSKREIKRLTH